MRRIAIVCFASMVACSNEAAVTCGDEECASNEVCDETHGLCVEPAQLDACRGIADGAQCDFSGGIGFCHDDVCVRQRCGDGLLDLPEQCDGANVSVQSCVELGYYTDGPVACTATCTLDTSSCTGACGDGVVEGPESCDGASLGGADCTDLGFYSAPGLACNSLCGFNTSSCTGFCGDGVINGPESCDQASLGGVDCTDLGFAKAPGLACNSICGYDTSSCSN